MRFLKQVGGAAALGVAMLVGSGLSAPPTQAGYIETLEQVGSNVVATGSGTLDLTDLSFVVDATGLSALILPSRGEIHTGPAVSVPLGNGSLYGVVSGPTSFGSGSSRLADSGSGDIVGIEGSFDNLLVPWLHFRPRAVRHRDIQQPDLQQPQRDPWHLRMDVG
jgi:hypothetical protein